MLCAVCQKKTATSCAVCKCVHYCSRDCQKLDWKSHKKFCNAFVIKEEEEEGEDGIKVIRRSVLAAKDLECGDYILEESPLFQIPRSPFIPTPDEKKNEFLICVTCGSKCTKERCSRCKWLTCVDSEKNCAQHKIHAENECGILASKKINYDSLAVHEDRRVLLILRTQAVKEKNPDLWNELMKRADEISASGQDSDFNREEISNLEKAMKKLDISNENMEIYKKFFSLLNLTSIFYNSYYGEIDNNMHFLPGIGKRRVIGDFLYPLANYFSHSCAPNCNFGVDGYPTFKIQIRAARSIKKGEKLTINSLLVPLFEGTIERRVKVKGRFGYLCKCLRCSDPTEFGTYFSGIVCNDCRPQGENPSQLEENVGYFLPLDLELDSKSEVEGDEKEEDPSSLAKCNGCQTIRPYSFFKDKLSSMRKELLENNKLTSGGEMPDVYREFKRMKLLLSKYSGKILHPNHCILHKVDDTFVRMFAPGMFKRSSHSEENIRCQEMWEGMLHFARLQEELETKLLHGSLMFNQVRLQDIIASGIIKLAIPFHGVIHGVREVGEIVKHLKEGIKLLEGAIHFNTKQMPTFCKRGVELACLVRERQNAMKKLEEFNLIIQRMNINTE